MSIIEELIKHDCIKIGNFTLKMVMYQNTILI